MEIGPIMCALCNGSGKRTVYKGTTSRTPSGFALAEFEEVVCDHCNGRGFVDFAVFSPEEAAAVLKHCGLPVEGFDEEVNHEHL